VQSFVIDALNGVSYGLLLFMLSAGLTLIFSMLGVLNFAHASFYMLGAYVGFSVAARAGFWWALIVAPLVVGLMGAALERWLLRRVRPHGHLAELLLTFGAAYLIGEGVKLVWGLQPLSAPVPRALDGSLIDVYGLAFSRYRAFMMAVAIAMLAMLYAVLRVSKAGLVVRAALTHPQAVEALGHDVPRVFTCVFAAGTGLAALAGVIGAPLFVVEPAMADSVGSIVFVVVVVGGLGSLGGALAASLIIGCLQTFAVSTDISLGDLASALTGPLTGVSTGASTGDAERALPPAWSALTLAQLAPLVPYVLLVAMLAVRSRGLFGQRDDDA
jgi:branched-chain amino acid transport system permease protein